MKWCPQCRTVHEWIGSECPNAAAWLQWHVGDDLIHFWHTLQWEEYGKNPTGRWDGWKYVNDPPPRGTYHGHCRNCFSIMHLSYPPTGYETCCNSGEER